MELKELVAKYYALIEDLKKLQKRQESKKLEIFFVLAEIKERQVKKS